MTQSPTPLAYLNGELLPATEASVAIHDLGVIMGATVTDMARTFRHKPFRIDDHVRRLYCSAKYARIMPPISRAETLKVIDRLLESNTAQIGPRDDVALALFLTAGEAAMYAGRAVREGPTYCIHTFPLPFQTWRDFYTTGVHVVTPSIRQVPSQCWDPKMKCRSRMHWWLATQEAHLVDTAAVPLCLDLAGNVTETSGANFVMVRDGGVIAPQPREILWGVSLATVAELCGELAIPFQTADFQVHDVINGDEAMLTSTPYSLAPVTRINGLPIGDGGIGPVFQRLAAGWSRRVGLDIVAQILGTES